MSYFNSRNVVGEIATGIAGHLSSQFEKKNAAIKKAAKAAEKAETPEEAEHRRTLEVMKTKADIRRKNMNAKETNIRRTRAMELKHGVSVSTEFGPNRVESGKFETSTHSGGAASIEARDESKD